MRIAIVMTLLAALAGGAALHGGGGARRAMPSGGGVADRFVIAERVRLANYSGETLRSEISLDKIEQRRLKSGAFRYKFRKAIVLERVRMTFYEAMPSAGRPEGPGGGAGLARLAPAIESMSRLSRAKHLEAYGIRMEGISIVLERLDGARITIQAPRASLTADRQYLNLSGEIEITPSLQADLEVRGLRIPVDAEGDGSLVFEIARRHGPDRAKTVKSDFFLYAWIPDKGAPSS